MKEDRINNTISNTFYPEYSEKLKNILAINQFKIYVWCNKNKSLYELFVSADFTIKDLLHIIKNAWPYPLPEPAEIGPYKVGLTYSIVYKDKKQPFNNKISEIGITENDIITFWSTITYADRDNNQRSGVYMEMITSMSSRHKMSIEDAIKKYEEIITKRFEQIDESLLSEK